MAESRPIGGPVLRASGEVILTQGGWRDVWESRAPQAMFSVAQRKSIFTGVIKLSRGKESGEAEREGRRGERGGGERGVFLASRPNSRH